MARLPTRVNADKSHLWKADVAASSRWFGRWLEPDPTSRSQIAPDPTNVGPPAVVSAPSLNLLRPTGGGRVAGEQHALLRLAGLLEQRGYLEQSNPQNQRPASAEIGTYALNFAVPLVGPGRASVTVDMLVQPPRDQRDVPILIRSFLSHSISNANRRRAAVTRFGHSIRQTRVRDGQVVLFLCGNFDAGFLGRIAAEGFDWVWAHRMDDLLRLTPG